MVGFVAFWCSFGRVYRRINGSALGDLCCGCDVARLAQSTQLARRAAANINCLIRAKHGNTHARSIEGKGLPARVYHIDGCA